MTTLTDRLLDLWLDPLEGRSDPVAEFSAVYLDPTIVNGTPLTVRDLVARATALQAAFSRREIEVLDSVQTADRLVIAFVLRARHDGPLVTPLGAIAPTGRDVELRTIDVLTVEDGRVSRIWVNGDELGLLHQLDAVRLALAEPSG